MWGGTAFAALREDGSVVTWGYGVENFNPSTAKQLDGTIDVISIASEVNSSSFSALRADGSVVIWGGNDIDIVTAEKLKSGVVKVVSDENGFAFLKDDNSIVTWNMSDSKAKEKLSAPPMFSSNEDFAAYQASKLKAYLAQGDSSAVKDKLSSGVVAFANPEIDEFYIAPKKAVTTNGQVINGTTGNDTLTGTSGNDTINGNGGFDSIDGGSGDDVINITGDNRSPFITVTGGAGKDYIKFSTDGDKPSKSTVTVTDFVFGEDILSLNQLVYGYTTVSLFYTDNPSEKHLKHSITADFVYTTSFEKPQPQSIVISSLSDFKEKTFNFKESKTIFDYSNESTPQKITGTDGDDLLIGGKGDDILNGSAGSDVAIFNSNQADYQISRNKLADGSVQMLVKYIGSGINEGTDTLTNIEMIKFGNNAAVNVADVKDTVVAVDKTIYGTAGNDKLSTNEGGVIDGLAGDDSIWSGGQGYASLIGGEGNDTLIDDSNYGHNTLTGGTGGDTFKFFYKKDDVITDFKSSEKDKIDLSYYGFTLLETGTTPFTAEGQLRYNAATNMLEGHTTGTTNTVDFSIKLLGVTAVSVSDFIL
jgi:Ca2+-binding RTX toxin-like protein